MLGDYTCLVLTLLVYENFLSHGRLMEKATYVVLSLGILAHRTSEDEQGVSFITSETQGI